MIKRLDTIRMINCGHTFSFQCLLRVKNFIVQA